MAKAFDVRVLAFSLGFGKRLFGFKRGETDYRVSLVPLGGYVRLGGENPDEVSDDPREFLNKPRWQRILVYLAGPAMNVVLSIGIMAVLFAAGTSVSIDPGSLEPVVGAVVDGSPAATAGLEPGDRIVSIGGDEVDDWQDVNMAIVVAPEKPVAITFERNGKDVSATVVPEKVAPYGYGDAGLLARGPAPLRPGAARPAGGGGRVRGRRRDRFGGRAPGRRPDGVRRSTSRTTRGRRSG